MSDTVLLTLIAAIAIIIVLYMFRQQLSRFFFKANRDGVETELQTREQNADATHPRAGVNITGNRQVGSGNQIDVTGSDANVERNTQLGRDQKLRARPDKTPKKKA